MEFLSDAKFVGVLVTGLIAFVLFFLNQYYVQKKENRELHTEKIEELFEEITQLSFALNDYLTYSKQQGTNIALGRQIAKSKEFVECVQNLKRHSNKVKMIYAIHLKKYIDKDENVFLEYEEVFNFAHKLNTNSIHTWLTTSQRYNDQLKLETKVHFLCHDISKKIERSGKVGDKRFKVFLLLLVMLSGVCIGNM
ncbi:hypothetical protein AADZ86_00865 [Colwelliaceae bacterium BS250]